MCVFACVCVCVCSEVHLYMDTDRHRKNANGLTLRGTRRDKRTLAEPEVIAYC